MRKLFNTNPPSGGSSGGVWETRPTVDATVKPLSKQSRTDGCILEQVAYMKFTSQREGCSQKGIEIGRKQFVESKSVQIRPAAFNNEEKMDNNWKRERGE